MAATKKAAAMSGGSRKTTAKKREGVIVRTGVQPVKITDSKKLGLKWNKPNAVMTGAQKSKSASGAQEEESAAGARPVLKGPRSGRSKVDTPAAQTIGFGRGAGSGQSKSRKQPRIATAISGPTSRAEPKVGGRVSPRRRAAPSPR
jgi:hypothetical protein